MKTVYLVSCVGKKAPRPLKAEDLYLSDWFLKARAYVLRQREPRDPWFILSALYGLVRPDHVIKPYEKTLLKMPEAERRAWADKVWARLKPYLRRGDRVVILAGERYRQFLEPQLTAMGCTVDVPMKGLGIGRQLSFLSGARKRQNKTLF